MILQNLLQNKKYAIANLAFIITWVIYFTATFYHPYIGIDLEKEEEQWKVVKVDPQGKGYKLGIQKGDIIVKVNQLNPDQFPAVKKWREIEGARQLEIQIPGQASRIVEVPRVFFVKNLFYEAPYALLSLGFWVTGFITLVRRQYTSQVQALFWFSWLVAIAIVLASASSRHLLWGRELGAIVYSFIPVMLLNLIAVFPYERRTLIFRYTYRLFAVIPILTIMLLYSRYAITISSFLLVALIVSSITALGHLIISISKLSKNSPERKQTATILTGLIIGLLPFIILTAAPTILWGDPIVNPRFSIMFVLFIPLTLSYVFIKKYLPAGELVLFELSIFLLAAIIAGVILSSLMFLNDLTNDPRLARIVFSQALIAILIFSSVKVGIGYLFNKLSFMNKEDNNPNKEEVQSLKLLRIINRALFLDIEEEKKRIARELHDGPLQLGMELNRRIKHKCEGEKNGVCEELKELADELNYQLRYLCSELRPATLSDLGLVPAVEVLCQELMERNLIEISLSIKFISREQRFSEELEITAYRFIQEGLNNVIRHSKSKIAKVEISIKENCLIILIQDYGKGFDNELISQWALQGERLGIVGMKERIARIGGDLKIKAQPGKGVILTATIPID